MINNKRLSEIEQEIYRRLKLWLKNSTWEEMTTEGSLIRFNMSLGMIGYPFEKSYEWMKNEKYMRFITDEEYDDLDYDELIQKIYYETQYDPEFMLWKLTLKAGINVLNFDENRSFTVFDLKQILDRFNDDAQIIFGIWQKGCISYTQKEDLILNIDRSCISRDEEWEGKYLLGIITRKK